VRFLTKGKQQRCVKVVGDDDRAGRQYGVSSVDVDCSGQQLLLSCTNHELVCYHWPSATLHSIYTSHKANFYTRARFSPDGRYIACGSLTGAVHVYEHDRVGGKGRRVRVMQGHEDEVGCVGWSRGEEYMVASCSDDHTVRVWRADRAAKSEEGEGDDQLVQEEECEVAEEEKVEIGVEDERDERMDEAREEESDKENEPHHHNPLMSTPPSLLFTPSSSSSSSSSAPLLSPFLVSSVSSSPSTPSSREPLADITNAIIDPRPAKRSKLSAAANKPLLAFFSPVDSASSSTALPSSGVVALSSSGKHRRADNRVVRGSSPTLLDFWSLPAEQCVEDAADMDMEQ